MQHINFFIPPFSTIYSVRCRIYTINKIKSTVKVLEQYFKLNTQNMFKEERFSARRHFVAWRSFNGLTFFNKNVGKCFGNILLYFSIYL